MKSPFKACVIGTGFIGAVHVEALKRAGVDVLAAIGSTQAKTEEASIRLGLPQKLDSLESCLRSPNIDSVHIATPNHLHHSQVKAVLAAGKHVLCEKPLAVTSAETRELVQLAADNRMAAAVAYNIRFYPHCHEARQRVREGQIGDVFHVQGSYVQDWLLKDTDFNWRVLKSEGGELRALADIGTHWLDLLQFIIDSRVVEVLADLRTIHPVRHRPAGNTGTFTGEQAGVSGEAVAIDTEDCGSVLLRFANGASGNLWVSQTTAGRKNCLRFELSGSQEAIAWNSEQPESLWLGHRDSPNQTLLRDPALLQSDARGLADFPGGHAEGFPDSFKQLFRSFYSYIDQGDFSDRVPFPTFEDGHYETRICEAILRSQDSRSWVTVTDGLSG